MKKLLAFAAFAFISLAATSAHAQSTISPVPGAKDTPHEPMPTNAPDQQPYGAMRSKGQQMPANRGMYKEKPMRGGKKMKKDKMMSNTGTM